MNRQFLVPAPFQWFPDMGALPDTTLSYSENLPDHLFIYDPLACIGPGDWIIETELGYRLVRRGVDRR